MKKKHFVDNYLIDPTHPVTIAVVGCGGTGSQVLSALARMNYALLKLDHPGVEIFAYDNDVITSANIGRQLFCESDIGLNKATVLISRLNRFFGTSWVDMPCKFDNRLSNIIITCVDNVKTRLEISEYLDRMKKAEYPPYLSPYYWLDYGNTQTSGQVTLGTVVDIKQPKSKKFETVTHIPCVTERFDLSSVDEKESGPSCSLAEALNKQDLFINSTLANLGCNLLWKLFREFSIDYAGLYLNLSTLNVNPIKL